MPLEVHFAKTSCSGQIHTEVVSLEDERSLSSLLLAIPQMQKQMNAYLTAEMTKEAGGTNITEEEPDQLVEDE